MQEERCPLCGGAATQAGSLRGRPLWHCERCSLTFEVLVPKPEDRPSIRQSFMFESDVPEMQKPSRSGFHEGSVVSSEMAVAPRVLTSGASADHVTSTRSRQHD